MADRIKGITIQLNGDATGLDKALKDVNNEIRDTEKDLKDVNRLLKLDPGNIELLTQKQNLLTKEIGDTQDKLKTLKNAAEDAKKALDNGEISQKQYDALQREIIETETKLKGLETQAKQTTEELSGKKLDWGKLADGAKAFATTATAAIAAVGAAVGKLGKEFIDAAKETAEYGDNVDKMSQKLGMSTDAYQEWAYVLEQNGADIEGMKTSMKTLATQTAANAAEFGKLGISQEELATLSQEEIFAKTIEGLQNMGEGAERTAIATKLLGKGAVELAPLLNSDAKSVEALKKQARDYGLVMSNDAVKSSAAFSDSLNLLTKTAEGLKNNLMAEFLPALTQVTDGLALLLSGDTSGIESISAGISTLTEQLINMMPQILEVGASILLSIATSIIDNLDTLLPACIDIVMQIANYIIENLPMILKTAVELIITLAKGIIEAIPDLIPALTEVILEMVDYLTEPDTLMMLINVGVELIVAIIEGLIKALPKLLAKVPEIIKNVATSFVEAIPELITSLYNALTNSEVINKFLDAGGQMLKGVWEGIKNMLSWLEEQIRGLGNLIVQALKNVLGIKSPSKVMADTIGKNLALGIGEGFADNIDKVNANMAAMVAEPLINADVQKTLNVSMGVPTGIMNMLGQYLPSLANQQIVLDTGTLVGETAPMYNKTLGKMARQGA